MEIDVVWKESLLLVHEIVGIKVRLRAVQSSEEKRIQGTRNRWTPVISLLRSPAD